MRLGVCGVFLGYADQHPDVPPVFERGDLCVVTAPDDEGVFRCSAISATGEIAAWRTDTVFSEKVLWQNQVPLIAHAAPGGPR